jgi:hypothetical protein
VVAAEAAPVAAAPPAAREAALPAAAEGDAVQVAPRAAAAAAAGRDGRDGRQDGEQELTGVWARIEPAARPRQNPPARVETPAPRRPDAARAGAPRHTTGASHSSSSSGQRQMSDSGHRDLRADEPGVPRRRYSEQGARGCYGNRDGERRGFGAAVLSGDFARGLNSSRGEQGRDHGATAAAAAAGADRDRERSHSPAGRPVARGRHNEPRREPREGVPRPGFKWFGAVAERNGAELDGEFYEWHTVKQCFKRGGRGRPPGCKVCHMVAAWRAGEDSQP